MLYKICKTNNNNDRLRTVTSVYILTYFDFMIFEPPGKINSVHLNNCIVYNTNRAPSKFYKQCRFDT